jgi:pectin methylesterase-like acyl-CoA thioesterase
MSSKRARSLLVPALLVGLAGCGDSPAPAPLGAVRDAGAGNGGAPGASGGATNEVDAGGALNGGAVGGMGFGGAGAPGGTAGAESGAGGALGGAGNVSGSGNVSAVGGAAGTGGEAGGGATAGGSGSTPDCNQSTGQPVVTVARDGSADFSTVQAAVDSIGKTNTTLTQIRIAPGTYQEKLRIDVPYVTLCGRQGQASSTILTYGDNANTPNGSGGTLGTTGSASTNISASNVSAENVTFANGTPLGGSQAVALLVTGDQVQFRSCRFLSFQDTLYVRKARQYFRDCYVEGSVDYIFGDATAIFENCTVHSAAGGVAVTAPNTDQSFAYGLVFLGGRLTAAPGVANGSVTLGRNWGAYGAAAYLRTTLGAHIKPVGWMAMGANTLDTARFAEYQTSGDGATASALAARAPQSRQLSELEAASYTVANVFGSWTPSFSR